MLFVSVIIDINLNMTVVEPTRPPSGEIHISQSVSVVNTGEKCSGHPARDTNTVHFTKVGFASVV